MSVLADKHGPINAAVHIIDTHLKMQLATPICPAISIALSALDESDQRIVATKIVAALSDLKVKISQKNT